MALLHVTVPAGEIHPLPLGDSASLQVGQKVLAIGNPLGLHNTLSVGLGFAVPIHLARRITADLIEMGHAYRPQLGFNGTEITPAIARLFGLPVTQGLLVEEVLPRSPAAVAGLRAGERIVVSGNKTFVLGGDIVTGINGEVEAGSGWSICAAGCGHRDT